jgi:hypothetical protein
MLTAPIDFSPMTDFHYSDDEHLILNLVDNTIDSLPHPISILT